MGQLLRFVVSSLDQVNIPLRSFSASLRFLLKGVQNINLPADLYCQHDPVGVRRVSQCNFKNSAADTFEGLRVPRHTAKLNELKLVSQQLLSAIWEIPKASFRVSKPDDGP